MIESSKTKLQTSIKKKNLLKHVKKKNMTKNNEYILILIFYLVIF
jgi:hypothetical protein